MGGTCNTQELMIRKERHRQLCINGNNILKGMFNRVAGCGLDLCGSGWRSAVGRCGLDLCGSGWRSAVGRCGLDLCVRMEISGRQVWVGFVCQDGDQR